MSINEFFEWYGGLDDDPEYLEEDLKIGFAVQLEQLMERTRCSGSELARRIESSPSYITKVMRGDSNMTIKSMVKLAHALDGKVDINISHQSDNMRWMGTVGDCATPAVSQNVEGWGAESSCSGSSVIYACAN